MSPPSQGGPARWFIFSGHKLLVRVENSMPDIPVLQDGPQDLGLEAVRLHFLGSLDGEACYSAEVPEGIGSAAGDALQRPAESV